MALVDCFSYRVELTIFKQTKIEQSGLRDMHKTVKGGIKWHEGFHWELNESSD